MATLNGTEGSDTIIGTSGNDSIIGRAGDDIIYGGSGSDAIFASGNLVSGPYEFETVYGGVGDDTINATGTLNIYGEGGDDFISAGLDLSNRSEVLCGEGDDYLHLAAPLSFEITEPITGFVADGGNGLDIVEIVADPSIVFDPDTNNIVENVLDYIRGFERYILNWAGVHWVFSDVNVPDSGKLEISQDLSVLIGQSMIIDASMISNADITFFSYGAYNLEILGGGGDDLCVVLDPELSGYHAERVRFLGGGGNDSLEGANWGDFFEGGAGDDYFDGADGMDTAIFAGTASRYSIIELTYNIFEIVDNVGDGGVDTIVDVNKLQFADQTVDVVIRGMEIIGDETDEAISGGGSADHVDGAGGDDTLNGLGGNDSIDGGTGADTVFGSVGSDFLNGDAGNDSLSGGAGNDSVDGGIGNDTLYSADGNDTVLGGDGSDLIVGGDGAGDDNYQGGTGIDTIKYTSALSGIDVNLSSGLSKSIGVNDVAGIGSDRLSSIENVIAGRYADKIAGNAASNTLNGGGGSDTMSGGLGNDTYVTDGGDRITESSNQGIDTVQSTVSYTLGYNIEKLVLTGSSALNGTGNSLGNTLTGNAASNTLNGGGGNDTLIGGAGADMLIGGLGKDVMTGGSGSDVFIFSNTDQSSSSSSTCDVITDFVHGVDKFNLRAIDAFSNTTSTNDNFRWNTGTSFNNTTQGEVRFKQFNNDGTANDFTMIYIDTDADLGAEMLIRLTGLHNLTASDFIL